MIAIGLEKLHSVQEEFPSNDKPINRIEPIVSVFVTAYQQRRFISQCLESILMQEINCPMEIVIGEDQSTDGTREICKKYAEQYPDKIRLFLRDRDQTVQLDSSGSFIKSINGLLTLQSCRGKYIAMCEGDDYWTSAHKLQRQVDFLSGHPEYSFCFHPVQVINKNGKNDDSIFPSESLRQSYDFSTLLKGNFIQTCSILYRNYDDLKLPSWFRQVKLTDWPLFLLLADRGRIGFIDEIMAVYRIHQGGAWGNKPRSEVLPAVIDMYRYVDKHFSGRYRAQIREITSSLHYDLANLQLQEKQRRLALGSAWKSLRSCRSRAVNPWKFRSFLLAKTLLPGRRRRNRPQNDTNEK